jgi:hypothetical protein
LKAGLSSLITIEILKCLKEGRKRHFQVTIERSEPKEFLQLAKHNLNAVQTFSCGGVCAPPVHFAELNQPGERE